MPWFSYHGGHSGEFCRHAKGTLQHVVEAAIERGFSHYGLSEHCPRDDDQWLYPEEKELGTQGLSAQFARYTAEARRLRDSHADRIELLVGFETERLPPSSWAQRMQGLRRAGGFEYIIGSVHHVGARWIDLSREETALAAQELGGVEALQRRYFQDLAELVEALKPEVVGHIDLIRKFDGDDADFSPLVMREVERTLESARAAGSLLDVNPGAYRRGLSGIYPLASILRRACELGVGVTLGDDSHGPQTVGVGLDACVQHIADAGYSRIHYLTRRDGRVVAEAAPLNQVAPR